MAKANNKYFKPKKPKKVIPESTDWITALARNASTSDNNTCSSSDSQVQKVHSKQERIDKRNAKKRRREERKERDEPKDLTKTNSNSNQNERMQFLTLEEEKLKKEHSMNRLSDLVQESVGRINEGKSHKERKFAKLFVPSQGKGKATAGQQLSDDLIQPRNKDYGGLGLARPSLLLDLRDISFIPKLEEEFAEHIPGFFGKQRTKAMKKQLDGDMLWRRLADKGKGSKKGNGKNEYLNVKVDGKKLSDMTPDDRVEAMIRLNMI